MKQNRRILFIVALIFTVIIALLAIDMGRRTTAPWNKKRQLERALPVEPDGTDIDTSVLDTSDTVFVEDSTSR
ncbi:hypothetical protein LX87_03720 [Larkinella arboricola]|uniref:Uncharacterized protein n=1 Tax=Larkinella arboricola TaxID=643671 RepID=A0A327WU73_LARAB|nr:hypothetical protein [Larkinella arboricola]RAJ95970.1 hypothetical protein LX87_03720 [Larkinella arboricola]